MSNLVFSDKNESMKVIQELCDDILKSISKKYTFVY